MKRGIWGKPDLTNPSDRDQFHPCCNCHMEMRACNAHTAVAVAVPGPGAPPIGHASVTAGNLHNTCSSGQEAGLAWTALGPHTVRSCAAGILPTSADPCSCHTHRILIQQHSHPGTLPRPDPGPLPPAALSSAANRSATLFPHHLHYTLHRRSGPEAHADLSREFHFPHQTPDAQNASLLCLRHHRYHIIASPPCGCSLRRRLWTTAPASLPHPRGTPALAKPADRPDTANLPLSVVFLNRCPNTKNDQPHKTCTTPHPRRIAAVAHQPHASTPEPPSGDPCETDAAAQSSGDLSS